ncbi:MAG: MFS transporter [Bacteroidales bacterium]|nr:MFS transporter [Bacteroidales bacterium]
MGKGSLRSTLAVSLNNYLDAGAIVAGASGITLWQNYLGLSEMHLGWLNAISANALGAAIGAIIGGFLADKYGRKFIFTYNLLVYMLGVLLVMCSVNFPMLLAGFLVTGISVGVGVPASWTYISESSEVHNRGRNICISQMSWGMGPMIILLFGMLFAPGGYLYGIVESLAHGVLGADAAEASVQVFSSRVVFLTLFIVAFVAWTLQRQLEESKEWDTRPTPQPLPCREGSGHSEQLGQSPLIPEEIVSTPRPTRAIAESERLATEGRMERTGGGSSIVSNIRALFTNRIAVRTVVFLAVIYLTWNLVASVMGFFQPHIYETAGGLSNEYANLLSCIGWLVVVVITFFLSFIIDRLPHRLFYVLGLVAALATWVVIISGVTGIGGLWAFSILWGVNGGLSVQIFYALWGSELFPAKFRAGAQGLMFFIVRGLSAVWGLVFTYIYGENGQGFTLAAWCMIALLLISLVVGVIGAPNTRGKSLKQITEERYGKTI